MVPAWTNKFSILTFVTQIQKINVLIYFSKKICILRIFPEHSRHFQQVPVVPRPPLNPSTDSNLTLFNNDNLIKKNAHPTIFNHRLSSSNNFSMNKPTRKQFFHPKQLPQLKVIFIIH